LEDAIRFGLERQRPRCGALAVEVDRVPFSYRRRRTILRGAATRNSGGLFLVFLAKKTFAGIGE
jgi:hypothetical protein